MDMTTLSIVMPIVCAIGYIAGYLTRVYFHRRQSGTLHVRHDDDGTYLTLQIRRLSDILGHKEVTFFINEEPRE